MVEAKLLVHLPEKTAQVLLALARAGKQKQTLANFVLVGGTALAIHLGHRQSEDLDFFRDGTRLEKAKLLSFLKKNDRTEIPHLHRSGRSNSSTFEVKEKDKN